MPTNPAPKPDDDKPVVVPFVPVTPALGALGLLPGGGNTGNAVPGAVSDVVAGVQDFTGALNGFDKLKYYINLYAVFYLASVVLAVGVLFIFAKPLLALAGGGKVQAVSTLLGSVKK